MTASEVPSSVRTYRWKCVSAKPCKQNDLPTEAAHGRFVVYCTQRICRLKASNTVMNVNSFLVRGLSLSNLDTSFVHKFHINCVWLPLAVCTHMAGHKFRQPGEMDNRDSLPRKWEPVSLDSSIISEKKFTSRGHLTSS